MCRRHSQDLPVLPSTSPRPRYASPLGAGRIFMPGGVARDPLPATVGLSSRRPPSPPTVSSWLAASASAPDCCPGQRGRDLLAHLGGDAGELGDRDELDARVGHRVDRRRGRIGRSHRFHRGGGEGRCVQVVVVLVERGPRPRRHGDPALRFLRPAPSSPGRSPSSGRSWPRPGFPTTSGSRGTRPRASCRACPDPCRAPARSRPDRRRWNRRSRRTGRPRWRRSRCRTCPAGTGSGSR